MTESNTTLQDIIDLKGGTIKELRNYARQKGIILPENPDYILSKHQLMAIDPLLAYELKWGKTIAKDKKTRRVTETPNPQITMKRESVKSFRTITSKKDVESVILCFIWPSLKYNREDVFYVQKIIGDNKKLLDYYHMRMKAFFGLDHVLKEEYETRKAKLARSYDSNVPEPKSIRIQEQKNTQIEELEAQKETPKEPVFEAQKPKTWILDWECVDFSDGYFTVHPPSNSGIYFTPLQVACKKAKPSFNYIRKYIKEKVPTVFCTVYARRLTISSPILIDDAVQTFARIARQKGIKVSSTPTSRPAPLQISFKQALSKAKQMTPAEFQKYKSKYIDYLVTLQSKKYKVIPCVERLAHTNSDNTEYTFMFSIECRSGKILIVHENVNPDRSTLLFLVKEGDYNKSIREIYDFLQSAEINKRSSLRNRSIEIKNAGIDNYHSINHDDVDSWKSTITFYKNYR